MSDEGQNNTLFHFKEKFFKVSFQTQTTLTETEVEEKRNSANSAPAAAAKSLQPCPTLCNPIDGSPPGSPSLGFSRQEHWSGLPFCVLQNTQ